MNYIKLKEISDFSYGVEESAPDGLRCPTRDGMHFTGPTPQLHSII